VQQVDALYINVKNHITQIFGHQNGMHHTFPFLHNKLIFGHLDGTFKPDILIRVQTVALLVVYGLNGEQQKTSFSDVSSGIFFRIHSICFRRRINIWMYRWNIPS
jgi:hypothetical protein